MPLRARTLTLAGTGAFVALVAVQHLTRAGDLPAPEHFVSEYALGTGGWVQTVAFGCWAASLAGATVLAARLPLPGGRRRLARGLTVAATAAAVGGAALCGAFETQTVAGVLPDGVARTTEGRLHDLGSLLVLGGLVAAALAAARLLTGGYRRFVGALALAFFAFPALLIMSGWDAPGIGQRGLIALGCAWTMGFAVAAERALAARATDPRA